MKKKYIENTNKMSFRIRTQNNIIYNSFTPLPSPSFDSEVLTNANGTYIWSYPQYYLDGNDMFPQNTVDISSIVVGSVSSSNKYFGGSLAPNGNIYCAPGDVSNVLIINPYTNTFDRTTLSGITNSNYPVIGTNLSDKWTGSVTFRNNIYMVPQSAKCMLNVNTTNNTFSFIDISSLANVTYNWYGAVLSANSNVYGIPHENSKVLRYDFSNNVASAIDISGTPGGTYKYACGVLAPNGNIYGIPLEATSILVINPVTNTARCDIPGLTGLSSGSKWLGGALAPNGKIYCAPYNSTQVLVIDPSNNTYSLLAPTFAGNEKWNSAVLAPNGKIYCVPHRSTQMLVIDPTTDTTSLIPGVNSVNYAWTGGVLAPNNKIYMIPGFTTNAAIVKTGLSTLTPWMMAPQYNKY